MREIKFRGKRVDDGRWVYGYYIYMGVTRRYADMEFAHMVLDSSSKDAEGLIQNEVIPETVGQYTGLKDKNGKEIYEGDIIEVGDMKIAIGWNSKTSSFHGLFMIGNRQMDTVNLGCLTSDDKIIGNIHTNPDILKEVSHEA